MTAYQNMRALLTVEYIKQQADFKEEGFHFNTEDIEEDLQAVCGFYEVFIDTYSDEEIAFIRKRLMKMAENEQTKEMVRIYAAEA
jgi:hypothetical protein